MRQSIIDRTGLLSPRLIQKIILAHPPSSDTKMLSLLRTSTLLKEMGLSLCGTFMKIKIHFLSQMSGRRRPLDFLDTLTFDLRLFYVTKA